MSASVPRLLVTPQLALHVLQRVGGSVRTAEIAYQLRRHHRADVTERDVLAALRQLEAQGLVEPWSWTIAGKET